MALEKRRLGQFDALDGVRCILFRVLQAGLAVQRLLADVRQDTPDLADLLLVEL